MKILLEMYMWTTKNKFHFGSHPCLDPDPGIPWKNSSNTAR